MDDFAMAQKQSSPHQDATAHPKPDGHELVNGNLKITDKAAADGQASEADKHQDDLYHDKNSNTSTNEELSGNFFMTPEPESQQDNQQQYTFTTSDPAEEASPDDHLSLSAPAGQDRTAQQLASPDPSQKASVQPKSPKVEVARMMPEKPTGPDAEPLKLEPVTKAEHLTTTVSASIKAEPIAGVKRSRPDPAASAPAKPTTVRKRQRNDDTVDGYDDTVEKSTSDLAVDQQCFLDAQNWLHEAGNMVLTQIEALAHEGYVEKEVHNIAGKLKKDLTASLHNIVTIKVGLLGDTASGKSSLINSLLNLDNLATEAEDGHSGTHVIHEFAMAEPSQRAKYMAKVYYHTNSRIVALVKEHLANIHDFEKTDPDTVEEEEYEQSSMRSNTAFDFFLVLLAGPDSKGSVKGRFPSTEKAKEWLKGAKSADDSIALEKLLCGINMYLDSLNRVDGATVISRDDMKELVAAKKIFAGPVKDSASPWPLVRKITIHVNARILRDGVVLADLPGLADTNLTRVKATKEYIKGCSTIIIVHPITRILSAVPVFKHVRECYRSGKIDNTVIAITNTDGFRHDRERHLSQSDQVYLDDLKRTASKLKEELEDLEDERDDAERNDEMKRYKELKSQVQEKKCLLVAAEADVRESNILIRNSSVAKDLQDKIEDMIGGGTKVSVFCISNSIYQLHRSGYQRSNPPELTVTGSGVPDLRAHLFEAPARQNLQKLMAVCKIKLPKALVALDLLCSKSALERKEDIMPKIEQPLQMFGKKLIEMEDMLKTEFARIMQGTYDTHWTAWKKEAGGTKVLRKWTALHWGRLLSFCRHEGVWKYAKSDEELADWNEQAAGIVADDLARAFALAKKTFDSIATELTDAIDAHLSLISTALDESEELMGMEMTAVSQSVDLTREDGKKEVQKLFRKLGAEMHTILHAATSAEDENSHILHSMLEVYAECKQMSGPGSHDRRKAAIKAKLLGANNVFLYNIEQTIGMFEDLVDKRSEVAEKRLGDAFETVVTNFNRRFDNEEVEDNVRKAFRLRLLKTVKDATAVKDTELKKQLLECDKYR